MGKQSIIRDQDGNPTHIRETSDDGRRSELYKWDNSLAAHIVSDHRGERVEVSDHLPNGKTIPYEADNSFFGRVFGDSKGDRKDLPRQQTPARLEERVEETSSSDNSDGEISEEVYERFVELLAEAIYKVREEQEAERRRSQVEYERQLAITREREARQEKLDRAKLARIDSLSAGSDINRVLMENEDYLDYLYELPRAELELKCSGSNRDRESREKAIAVKIVKNTAESEVRRWASWNKDYLNGGREPQSDFDYLNRKRALELMHSD